MSGSPPPRGAGRELDAEVAQKVMGLSRAEWRSVCFVDDHRTDDYEYDASQPAGEREAGWCYTCSNMVPEVIVGGGVAPPRYSTDIAAAWLVVEKMIEDGGGHLQISIEYQPTKNWPHEADAEEPSRRWCCRTNLSGTDMLFLFSYAETAALAICRNALEEGQGIPGDPRP